MNRKRVVAIGSMNEFQRWPAEVSVTRVSGGTARHGSAEGHPPRRQGCRPFRVRPKRTRARAMLPLKSTVTVRYSMTLKPVTVVDRMA